MSAVSFLFGMSAATAGIVFAFMHHEQAIAAVCIEVVAGLGFFFARWCQRSYAPLLARTIQTEQAAHLLMYDQFVNDPEIRKYMLHYLLRIDHLFVAEPSEKRSTKHPQGKSRKQSPDDKKNR